MATFLIVHDERGKIFRTMGGLAPMDNPENYVVPGELYTVLGPDLEGIPVPSKNRLDFKTRRLVYLGEPPSEFYDYDWQKYEWAGNPERLRLGLRQAIEAALAAKVDEPTIWYDNKSLDADARSKEAVRNKAAATGSRIDSNAPTNPDQLVWKDHDNIVHRCPDLKTYKQWLDGLLIALDDRTETARSWAAHMKEELNGLRTFDQLEKFKVPPIAP